MEEALNRVGCTPAAEPSDPAKHTLFPNPKDWTQTKESAVIEGEGERVCCGRKQRAAGRKLKSTTPAGPSSGREPRKGMEMDHFKGTLTLSRLLRCAKPGSRGSEGQA